MHFQIFMITSLFQQKNSQKLLLMSLIVNGGNSII